MRSSARLPGRKLVFFISDGFLAQGGPLGASFSNKIRQITDAAQSANTVIYSIDARGLVSGTLDATNNLVTDANGRTATLAAAEILATQDALGRKRPRRNVKLLRRGVAAVYGRRERE
jgi:hypothetical protein